MSRGLGDFQLSLLARLRSQGSPTTIESLRWDLADEDGCSGDLPKPRAFALQRAVNSLAERSLLRVERRKLVTIQEWLAHYPGKTYRRDVRRVRIDLLPVLANWVRGQEGPGPLFNADANERFFARAEGADDSLYHRNFDRGAHLASRWKALEPELRKLLAHCASENLFLLIARGKNMFTGTRVETRVSFGELIDLCADEKILPEPIHAELESIRRDFIPPDVIGALKLKSVIYQFITSVIHRHPELKAEALRALYQAKPDYMRALPGYKPPTEPVMGRGLWIPGQTWGGFVEPRSALSRLIDQTTFQSFQFLALPDNEKHRGRDTA